MNPVRPILNLYKCFNILYRRAVISTGPPRKRGEAEKSVLYRFLDSGLIEASARNDNSKEV